MELSKCGDTIHKHGTFQLDAQKIEKVYVEDIKELVSV
jgi:hypothetical protein